MSTLCFLLFKSCLKVNSKPLYQNNSSIYFNSTQWNPYIAKAKTSWKSCYSPVTFKIPNILSLITVSYSFIFCSLLYQDFKVNTFNLSLLIILYYKIILLFQCIFITLASLKLRIFTAQAIFRSDDPHLITLHFSSVIM